MALAEAAILAVLVALIRLLSDRAQQKLEISFTVTVVWQLELWWSQETDRLSRDGRIGPEAAATLRTALGDLAQRLDQAATTGATPEALRSEVLRFRDRWEGWARTVAITESTRSASEAILSSPEALRPGAMKEWVSSHDSRVRTSHREADGQIVPASGTFVVGGFPVRYPGDPLGPPEEIIGCRCYPRIVDASRRAGRAR